MSIYYLFHLKKLALCHQEIVPDRWDKVPEPEEQEVIVRDLTHPDMKMDSLTTEVGVLVETYPPDWEEEEQPAGEQDLDAEPEQAMQPESIRVTVPTDFTTLVFCCQN